MAQPTVCWQRNCVKLIDQTKLPHKLIYVYCRDIQTLWKAIKELKVRGAPAIGVAAAFGVLLGAESFRGENTRQFIARINKVGDYLAASRPTAVNLFNCIQRMKEVLKVPSRSSVEGLKKLLKKEAFKIYEEDRRICRAMAVWGARLIRPRQNILTICNAGALATVDYGTALGVMYKAKEQGKIFRVYACETRPLLQGARLTAWELLREKIDTTLICDNMAASLMKEGKIDAVFVGADRIALNGDTANKIGTYNLAVLARYHAIPFYVVAPLSTFDRTTKTGRGIPIEERNRGEVVNFNNRPTAPEGVKVYNPAFDVTDQALITAIVTEKGIMEPPFKGKIKKILCLKHYRQSANSD